MGARKMIRSFSQVSAFQRQIIEINKPSGPKGYSWKRRGAGLNHVYCDGKVIGQCKSTSELSQIVKDHAKRKGEWFLPTLLRHQIISSDGLHRLYINGAYCKKSRCIDELKTYVEVMSWLKQTNKDGSWGKR
jgi:hypothetical protein